VRYTVYMEHRVSWAWEGEASSPEEADMLAMNECPHPTNSSNEVDPAGGWETGSIVDSEGKEHVS
jgi:hypothetical protein